MDRAIDKMNVGKLFGLQAAPEFSVKPIDHAVCSITRLQRHVADHVEGFPINIPARNAYFMMLYLQAAFHCDLLSDGTKTVVKEYSRGAICLVDLKEGASIELHSDLDAISFVLPNELFDELSTFHLTESFTGLKCVRATPDTTMTSIGLAMIPFFGEITKGFRSLDHIAIAICAHVLHNYSVNLSAYENVKADRQDMPLGCYRVDLEGEPVMAMQSMTQRLRLAKRLLDNDLMSLEEITKHCGFLGVRQFCNAFKQETGMSPTDWQRCRLH